MGTTTTTSRSLQGFLLRLLALPAGIALLYLTPRLGETLVLGWSSTTLAYLLSAWLVFVGVLSPISLLPERAQRFAHTFVLLLVAFIAFSTIERIMFSDHDSPASLDQRASTKLWSA